VINQNLSVFRAYRDLWDPVHFMSGRSISSHNKFHAVMTKNRSNNMKSICPEAFAVKKCDEKAHFGRLSSFMASTKA
jgi:hypothetical protein